MSMNHAGAHVTSFQRKPESTDIPHRRQPWYAAYMAALFESERMQLRERIRYAEQLMLTREHELSFQSSESAEQRALHNGLHALRTLWSCLNL
jgi:hypothetical protein